MIVTSNHTAVAFTSFFCSSDVVLKPEHGIVFTSKSTPATLWYRVKFNVSDETCTLFKSELDYLKRGKRLNYLTHWDIQVTGGGR